MMLFEQDMVIGDTFGICRERVRQIERKVLRRLKHPKYAKILAPLVQEIKEEDSNG